MFYEKGRLAKVLERPLIQAKSINWFFRGTLYLGGFLWVAFEVLPEMWEVFEWRRNGDLRMMFDMLPFCLLGGFIWGLIHACYACCDESKGQKDLNLIEEQFSRLG